MRRYCGSMTTLEQSTLSDRVLSHGVVSKCEYEAFRLEASIGRCAMIELTGCVSCAG